MPSEWLRASALTGRSSKPRANLPARERPGSGRSPPSDDPTTPMTGLLQHATSWLSAHEGWLAVLGFAWLLYLVLLGGWIVLQKREPVATLSWLLGLALLPFVGFLVYHVFGPQKIRRHRLKRALARADLLPEEQVEADDEALEIARMA